MNTQEALLNAALDYVSRGMALTWFEYGQKFPTHKDWNTPGKVITTPEAARARWGNGQRLNIGLVHSLSPIKTCSLDVDHVEWTRNVLAEFGIDLDAWRVGIPCVQGNPANFRLEYRQPPGMDLPLVKLTWPDPNDPKLKITVFELRAGANQDVLPPSLHPNGQPYIWTHLLPDNPDDQPEPPPALLELWLNWEDWEPALESACPWATPAKTKSAPRSKTNLDIIGQFNRVTEVRAILEAHGYQPRGKSRYLPPNSHSGVPSVRLLDSGKVFSDNGSCPLNDGHAHDAFDCHRILAHGGDLPATLADAAAILGIERPTTVKPQAPDSGKPDAVAERKCPKKTLNTVVKLLSASPWAGVIGFNEFRQCIEKRTATPYQRPAGAWVDSDTAETMLHLERMTGTAFGRDMVDLAVLAVAHRNAFNPAQDRLRALAGQWDGQTRLDTWLVDFLNAAVSDGNREYLAEIGEKWLKGVAARILIPGCKRDDVLVIRSPQGWRKSTAAQAISDAILPEAFTDSIDLGNLPEAKIQIRGIIIAELGELAGLAKAEVESIKAFVSAKSDHFREKFGRYAQDFNRTVSFIGSTNDQTFLKDPTGNRRWWPVTLAAPVDIPRLQAALPQLIGEAAQRVMDGEAWHVTAEKALEQAERVREAHYEEDVWTDAALAIVDSLESNGDPVTIPAILDALNIPRMQQSPFAKQRVAGILKVSGYEEARKWLDRKAGRRLRFWRKLANAPDPMVSTVSMGTSRQTGAKTCDQWGTSEINPTGTPGPDSGDRVTIDLVHAGHGESLGKQGMYPVEPVEPLDSVYRVNFSEEKNPSPLAQTILATLDGTPMTRVDLERAVNLAHGNAGPALINNTINQLLLSGAIAPLGNQLVKVNQEARP